MSDTPSAQRPGVGALAAVAATVFLFALLLRLWGIGTRDLWLDEIYTQFAASRDWLGLVDDRVGRGHSPFYFALLKLTGIDPSNVAAIRAPSAVFDAGAAAVLSAGVLRYFGWRSAVLVGALYVFSPLHIHWAQNARPYGLLMLFTAMGLVGALGLVASIGRDTVSRVPHWLFLLGWSGACLTLTGGILTYLVVLSLPWWPGLRRGALADPAFRRRWIAAQKVPSVVAFLTYMLVSRLHVVDRIGDYWLQDRRPFGAESLQLLVAELATGEVGLTGIGPAAGIVLALLACAVLALIRPGLRPAAWPVFALGFGVSLVMLAMSLNTSLLTGRYFTPAWMGLLVAAGLGLATLRPPALMLLSAPLLGLLGAFSAVSATVPSVLRALPPQQIAALINGTDARHAPIVADRAVFRALRMELMLLRLDAPGLPRPQMHGARGGSRVAERIAEGGVFFIVASPAEWAALRAAQEIPSPCVAEIAPWVVVRAGGGPCAAPFAAPLAAP
ncbi:MAG: hypothetical protein AAGB05_13325 [Pseudomonadota bacterium]